MATPDPRLDWNKLLSSERQSSSEATTPTPEPVAGEAPKPAWLFTSRLDVERDGDRILFATPTRRLGDKTQVFPLERIESVRNRLTHSHEVSALARSIGTHLVHSDVGDRIIEEVGGQRANDIRREIPAILGAVSLAHDIGNPPFGHQGETAIRDWVKRNEVSLFTQVDPPSDMQGYRI